MKEPDHQHVRCDHPGCEAKIKNHAWGKIRAEGWFFQRNGKAYCPDHLPEWVDKWRGKRA